MSEEGGNALGISEAVLKQVRVVALIVQGGGGWQKVEHDEKEEAF